MSRFLKMTSLALLAGLVSSAAFAQPRFHRDYHPVRHYDRHHRVVVVHRTVVVHH